MFPATSFQDSSLATTDPPFFQEAASCTTVAKDELCSGRVWPPESVSYLAWRLTTTVAERGVL